MDTDSLAPNPPVALSPGLTVPATPAPRQHLKIRPASGWQALNLLQIWQYRDLLLALASRDVKLRYKQTALGAIWVVFQPLLAAGIFSFVFGKVANLSSDGVPYFIFSYVGLLAWNVFANTLTKVSGSLVGNAHLISKVFFPRLVLPISTVFSTLIDFSVAFTMLLVLLPIYKIAPTWNLLLLPIWLLLVLLLAMGAGLFTSALMVSYRDVQYILPVLTQFLLYGSPIAYAVSAVPQHLQFYYLFNPLSSLLEGFRWSVLGQGELHFGFVAYGASFAVMAFVIGAFAFKRMERKFADVI